MSGASIKDILPKEKHPGNGYKWVVLCDNPPYRSAFFDDSDEAFDEARGLIRVRNYKKAYVAQVQAIARLEPNVTVEHLV